MSYQKVSLESGYGYIILKSLFKVSEGNDREVSEGNDLDKVYEGLRQSLSLDKGLRIKLNL